MFCEPSLNCATVLWSRFRLMNRDMDCSLVTRCGTIPEIIKGLGTTSKIPRFCHWDVEGYSVVSRCVRRCRPRRRLFLRSWAGKISKHEVMQIERSRCVPGRAVAIASCFHLSVWTGLSGFRRSLVETKSLLLPGVKPTTCSPKCFRAQSRQSLAPHFLPTGDLSHETADLCWILA